MRWLKKIILTVAGLFLLIVTGIGLYAWVRNDSLTADLVRKVNGSINTKISYGNLRLTIFESFPNITVRFSDLLVEPSPFYDKTQFRNENNDTLLSASSLSVTAHLLSLLTGKVAVRSVTIRDGEVNLLTDKRGDFNFRVISGDEKKKGKSVRLNNITATEMRAVWYDRSSGMRISGDLPEAVLSGEIFRSGIFLSAELKADIDSINISGLTFDGFPLNASFRMRKSENSISVARGILGIADLEFIVDGMVNYSMSTLDLAVEGRKINIASVVSMLPAKWRSMAGGLSPSGIVDITGSITGPYGEAGRPHVELSYGLEDGRVSQSSGGLKVNDLSFRGKLTNGAGNGPETTLLTLDRLNATFGSATLSGSFMLNNLAKPHITLDLSGDLNFSDLRRVLNSDYFHDPSGSVTGSIKLSGELPDSLGNLTSALPSLKPDASFVFSNFGATLTSKGISLKDANGTLVIGSDLIADSLSFTLMDQHYCVNVLMRNFTAWLAGRPETLTVSGGVSVDRFVTAAFTGSGEEKHDSTGRPFNIFPQDVSMRVALRADSVISKGFRAGNLTAVVSYEPYLLTFSDIRAESLDGIIAGEFRLGRQKGGGYITRSLLNVTDIDINKTFTAFNNFGQTFIVSDNLFGNLTGNVTVLAPLDSAYKVVYGALAADAHLVITDGRLVSFAPAMSLSSYLDLDELKDISFSKMENDLFISNSTVSVPRMLVNSSAINFTLYGTHKFNGDYTYHARLLLSEVLSRKARERSRDAISFGHVQVDGTGKVTLPLKIESVNGQVSVGYDFGQAQDNLKQDVALEKQTLKGILNEEYGWYETDTLKTKPAATRPKFTITWEEGKEPQANTGTQEEEVTESPLKVLFKKKK